MVCAAGAVHLKHFTLFRELRSIDRKRNYNLFTISLFELNRLIWAWEWVRIVNLSREYYILAYSFLDYFIILRSVATISCWFPYNFVCETDFHLTEGVLDMCFAYSIHVSVFSRLKLRWHGERKIPRTNRLHSTHIFAFQPLVWKLSEEIQNDTWVSTFKVQLRSIDDGSIYCMYR